jgi:hypothetical protein
MSIVWSRWINPAEGRSSPGSPITAVPIATAPGQFALFIADPGGYIYTASGNAQVGWGEWSWVAKGQAAPGSPVTALPIPSAPGTFALFIANPSGEVFTTSGNAEVGWAAWTNVAEGSTSLKQLITAVPITTAPDQFAIFIADPNGYIYTASGNAQVGWGKWSWVAKGQAAPGSPVTALPIPTAPGQFILFIAGYEGQVLTTSGSAQQGWAPWSPVADGVTSPKQLITAVPITTAPDQFAVFIADPNGYIYTVSGNAQVGWGEWSWIAQGQGQPGSPVTAVALPKNQSEIGYWALFITKADGSVYMNKNLGSVITQWDWANWGELAGVTVIPGSLVTAVNLDPDPLVLFVANAQGEVYTASSRLVPPETPTSVQGNVVSLKAGVGESSIRVGWLANYPVGSVTSFQVGYKGAPPPPPPLISSDEGQMTVGVQWNATFPATCGLTYTITVEALNAAGTSDPGSTTLKLPYVPPLIATLVAQVIWDSTNAKYVLGIQGSNFALSELVDLVVLWSIKYPAGVDEGDPIFLTANANFLNGGFQTSSIGDGQYGYCPIEVALGESQPPQTFQVTATGSTSKKTATATTTFTCPLLVVPDGD